MNKEKLVAIKNKIKENAPDIIIYAGCVTSIAISAYVVHAVKKLNISSTHLDDVELWKPVDPETRQTLMEDKKFDLYKVSDDEYTFAHTILED